MKASLGKVRFTAIAMICVIATGLLAVIVLIAPRAQEAGTPSGDPSARSLITGKIDETDLVTLTGTTRPEANAHNDRGPVPNDFPLQHMMLQLRRPPEREKALERFMEQQTDLKSANYHHWLTAAQFGKRYGLAQRDLGTLERWLESHGFKVNAVYANNVVIDFSGDAREMRQAFHTEVHYLDVNGKRHYANMSDPSIPAALAPAVLGIASIHDFTPRPALQPRAGYTVEVGQSSDYPVVPADLATIYNLNGAFSAGYSGQGQTFVAVEDSDLFSTTDWANFRSTFGLASAYSSGSLTTVHPAPGIGGTNCTDPGATGDDNEATLDAEWASAAAPNATIELATCANAATFGGFIALQNLLNNGGLAPAVIDISYLESETALGASENAFINGLMQQAAVQGASVFVAAGDSAAATNDRGADAAVNGINVNGIASTPYDVAVGGTDFSDTYSGSNDTYWSSTNTADDGSALSYIPEIPWNDSCASQLIANNNGYLEIFGLTTYGVDGFCNNTENFLDVIGGGGGPSGCATGTPSKGGVVGGSCAGYPKPAWQSVLGNPSDGVRDLPDISLFAANGIWGHSYLVCFSDLSRGGSDCSYSPSGWYAAGGTSFGAPIMAAIQLLADQIAGSNQGNPNPRYYAVASAEYGASGNPSCNSSLGNGVSPACTFYDVTLGDTDIPCTGSNDCYLPSGTYGVLSTSNSAYDPAFGTTTGWDFATGIGTVNAWNLVTSFGPTVAPTATVSPTATVTATSAGTTSPTPTISPAPTATASATATATPTPTAVPGKPAIFVSNSTGNSVTGFSLNSNGNAQPFAVISGSRTALESPAASGIALDASGNIYVSNDGGGYAGSITIYWTGSSGNVSPSGTISGINTQLYGPNGITLDSSGNIYVANSSRSTINMYAAGSSGDVAPSAIISGSNTGLSNPYAIALDAGGNIYVANDNNDVLIYAAGSSGNVAPSLSISGPDTGLRNPAGIALDSNGNIYVANSQGGPSYLGSITVYPAGSYGNVAPTTAIVGGGTGLHFPLGIALDSSGNIYVANSDNRVTVYPAGSNGNVTPSAFVGGSNTDLNFPVGIAIWPPSPPPPPPVTPTPTVSATATATPSPTPVPGEPAVFVSNSTGNSVTAFPLNSDGNAQPFAVISGSATGLESPAASGIALDASGNIYVSNDGGGYDGSITVYPAGSNGNVSPSATIGGFNTQLYSPNGITLDSSGNIYVANGSRSTINVYAAGSTGDVAPTAIINAAGLAPYQIALDSSGNIYVTNFGGNSGSGYNGYSVAVYPAGSSGNVTPSLSITGPDTGLRNPAGIALDSNGNIYVANFQGGPAFLGSVTVYPAGSNGNVAPTTTIVGGGTDLHFPLGIALDSSGNIYVANSNNQVTVYPAGSNGNVTPSAIIGGSNTDLNYPVGIAIANWPIITSTPSATPTATTSATATATNTATATATATATPMARPTTSISVPATLALGSSPVGDTVTKNLTIVNTGTHAMFIGSVTSSNPAEVTTGVTTCPPTGLAHLGSCTIAIGFTPSALGTRNATLSVYDNAASSPQHVAASGTGTVDMTVTPVSFAIGDVKVGSKAIEAVVVHNFQTTSVSLGEGFSGPNAGDFSVTGSTCWLTLAAKTVCTRLVTFAPTSVGTESAALTVTDSPDTLGPYTVSFMASATVPESLSASRMVFGNVYETASKTLNLTVTNKAATGSITLTGTTIGGANSGDFAVTGGSCTGSLAPSSSCTYAVTFTPSIESAESGTLSVGVMEDRNGGQPAVALSGTGLTPLRVVPANIAFGTVVDSHSSTNRTVTVINDGGAAASLSQMISGTNFADFSVTGGTCTSTLAGSGASCTYTLKFTPSIVGSESATLGVSAAGDAASPHNVSFGGAGS